MALDTGWDRILKQRALCTAVEKGAKDGVTEAMGGVTEVLVDLAKRVEVLESKVMGIPPRGIRIVEDVVDITANGDQEPKTLIVKRPAIGEDKQ